MTQFRSANPATGETLATFDGHAEADVDAALAAAERAVEALAELGVEGRLAALRRAAAVLEDRKPALAEMMTAEMGKPIAQAEAEIDKCAWVCRHYADTAGAVLEGEPLEAPEKGHCRALPLPLGPILAVMPWNFPFWQVFRFAAPNLALGNPGLLKHASAVPQCARAIERIFTAAGFPDGAFQTLLITGETASKLLEDERVRGATVTGSEGAGAAVAEAAGRALKKVVLELGGSDPFIVMPGADVQKAAETAVTARVQNNGQSCIAAKRFIVHDDIYDAFRERFRDGLAALRVGDPADRASDLGPLVNPDAADEVHRQFQEAIRAGGRDSLTAERGGYAYLSPGLVEDLPAGASVRHEEIFGPVALLFRAANLDEAIATANETPFGLGASFWSDDDDEIDAACRRLQAGSTYVNQMVASDPRLPFGGIKRSGHGRELAQAGLLEFANVKTVAVTR